MTPEWIQALASLIILIVTGVYVGISWGLFRATKQYAQLTHELVRLQMEPALNLTLRTTDSTTHLIISNPGPEPVVTVEIDPQIVIFAHPRPGVVAWKRGFPSVGPHQIERISPDDSHHVPLTEALRETMTLLKGVEVARARGDMEDEGVPRDAVLTYYGAMYLVVGFRRVADRKRFRVVRTFLLSAGKSFALQPDAQAVSFLDADSAPPSFWARFPVDIFSDVPLGDHHGGRRL